MKSLRYLPAFALALLLPITSQADIIQPEDMALAQSVQPHANECLTDFGKRVKNKVELQPMSELSFNEYVTGQVYRKLYWNGSNRGVAYTLPVKAQDKTHGVAAIDIACFYSIVSGQLKFQYSQQIVQRL